MSWKCAFGERRFHIVSLELGRHSTGYRNGYLCTMYVLYPFLDNRIFDMRVSVLIIGSIVGRCVKASLTCILAIMDCYSDPKRKKSLIPNANPSICPYAGTVHVSVTFSGMILTLDGEFRPRN